MEKLISLIIPVFGGIGGLLFLLTVGDFDAQVCSKCWPVEFFLYFTYFLFILTIGAALIGAANGIISNPKSIKSSGLGIGLMLLVMGISYALGSDEVFAYYGDISPSTSKWVDAGLYMLYFLMLGSVAAIVYAGVSSVIKK